MEDVDFFYFTYGSVDFHNEKIDGWVYEKRNWKRKEMDFPDVIINISSPKNTQQSSISKQLKEKCIFTSHSVGNKMKVYMRILKGNQYSEFLIPSYIIKNANKVPSFFNTHYKMVIKPLTGNHGKNVYFIEKIDHLSYLVMDGNDHTIYSNEDFTRFVESLLHIVRLPQWGFSSSPTNG